MARPQIAQWTGSLLCAVGMVAGGSELAWAARAPDETQIKRMIEQVLATKQKEVGKLEARVRDLEALTRQQQAVIEDMRKVADQAGGAEAHHGESTSQHSKDEQPAKRESPLAKFITVKRKSAEPEEPEDEAPKVGGFFDVTAQTKTGSSQIFNVGVVELDFDRILHSGHFAASAALDWFPYGTLPNAQIGVAIADFHLYDDAVPVRGRIFDEPGFHIQAGIFDLPFASDYQFFASRDRLTVTPPYTTTRIQQSGVNPSNGGFNSTGVRTYGNTKHLNYAVFATDSIYSNGTAIGGRVGFMVNNPYRLHKRQEAPILDVGFSTLFDMDSHERIANELFAADFSVSYGPIRVLGEYLARNSRDPIVDGAGRVYGQADEDAYHVTAILNFDDWLEASAYVYGRFQEWSPGYRFVVEDDVAYRVRHLPGVSIGFGYRFNDYVLVKLEYSDTLGNRTAQPGFQSKFGIAQLVASF